MDPRSRRGRGERSEMSPDRVKVCTQQPRVKPIKKVQVVYYLSRNGQLEHPHYMEVSHLANQHLRLRDFTDRLTVLRGKGMPSLYSWSCKRSYKNGYVWNDLAENDIIHPSDGAEYVLKGSELVEGCPERLQQLHVSNNRQLIQEPNLHAKRKQLLEPIQQPRPLEETHGTKYYQEYDDEESQESQEEYEDEEKTSYTSSTTPHSRCSRGVSTDELEEQVPRKNPTTESTQHHTPPESTPSILSEKPRQSTNNSSKRFEDGDPVAIESVPGRNSVLLQLISCGNLTVAKAKNNVPSLKQPAAAVTVNGPNANVVKRSVSDLHRGVLYKTAVKVAEEEMISYMSENPRFGNLQSEEKEYFSGSIIESMSENRVVDEPALKRSNSYNEERCTKAGMEDVQEEVKEKAARGKCIPLKKSSSSSKQAKK
ncbi:protein UPSTREAM OF FLC [Populus alba x Populus x berolinensis]|nr:protein UPSTREAM OF FLC [Populus alba x Populus x berolinensis]